MKLELAILGSLLALAGPVANAEVCAEGRVATEASAGRCCWPAQRWDPVEGRCDGPPRCPQGMVGAGASCVPRSESVVAPRSARPFATRIEVSASPAPDSAAVRDPAPAERLTYVPNWPLVGTSIALILTGWVPMVVDGTIRLAGSDRCGSWGAANYGPVLGGAIFALGHDLCRGYGDDTLALAAGYASTGVQVLAIILLIVGLSSRRPRVARGDLSEWSAIRF